MMTHVQSYLGLGSCICMYPRVDDHSVTGFESWSENQFWNPGEKS